MRAASPAAARRSAARAAPAPSRPARAPARVPGRAPSRAPRRPRPARRSARPGRIVPLAIGRPAAAISHVADTGLFLRLTRGRLWIVLLTALLVGIVAINVFALSFGATASRLGREADGLQRANSSLRARLASKLSDLSVQQAALRSGLVFPPAGSIRYVRARPGDARRAARRLADGDLVAGAPPVPAAAPATSAPASTATGTAAVPATTATSTP